MVLWMAQEVLKPAEASNSELQVEGGKFDGAKVHLSRGRLVVESDRAVRVVVLLLHGSVTLQERLDVGIHERL